MCNAVTLGVEMFTQFLSLELKFASFYNISTQDLAGVWDEIREFSFVTASFFDEVNPVYTTPIETIGKPGRLENTAKSGASSKRYGFICRVNSETASI